MNVDPPGRPTNLAASSSSSSRKRCSLLNDSDSEGTILYFSEDSSDDGFQPYLSRKTKRRLLRADSSSSQSTVKTTAQTPTHTILVLPIHPTDKMRWLNRQAVSVELEALAPNEIKDVRVNSRRNVVAVDVYHASALETLRVITQIGGMPVHTIIPLSEESSSGVIYDDDEAITKQDLPILVKPAK